MASNLKLKTISIAVCAAAAGSFMMMPVAAQAAGDTKAAAADKTMMPASSPNRSIYSDREMSKPWSNERQVLEGMLKPGQNKAFYTKALADHGYQITSINAETPERVEYEVVKGAHSYEVQINFDKSAKATKVDIDGNMWRADATKAALRGNRSETPAAYVAANERFSDRARMQAWKGEKEQLEKALKTGMDKAGYANELKRMGYQITSTNDNEKDYLEYEIVKGGNSYEVQIDLDGGKGKKVDVTTNMWQTEATEKAVAASLRTSAANK